MLWEDRWVVKKKEPLVLEDKLIGQDFQKLIPLLQDSSWQQWWELCHGLHWEQGESLGPISTTNSGAFAVSRVSCCSSALQINPSQKGHPHQIWHDQTEEDGDHISVWLADWSACPPPQHHEALHGQQTRYPFQSQQTACYFFPASWGQWTSSDIIGHVFWLHGEVGYSLSLRRVLEFVPLLQLGTRTPGLLLIIHILLPRHLKVVAGFNLCAVWSQFAMNALCAGSALWSVVGGMQESGRKF